MSDVRIDLPRRTLHLSCHEARKAYEQLQRFFNGPPTTTRPRVPVPRRTLTDARPGHLSVYNGE